MKYRVQYESGTSRYGREPVHYMLDMPSATFYAECVVPDGASEDYGYHALKAEILRQAAAGGVPAEEISFWYDGQEALLDADASAGTDVRGDASY